MHSDCPDGKKNARKS